VDEATADVVMIKPVFGAGREGRARADGGRMRSWSTGRRRNLQFGVFGALAVLGSSRTASANGFEYPELGTEVMGRAGAYTAKADAPIAMALNPAGLAGQGTAIFFDANAAWQSMCFQRAGAYPNQNGNGAAGDMSGYAGAPYPQVCKDNGLADVNVVPTIIFSYQVTPKLSLAAGLASPNAAGKSNWPTEVAVSASDGSTVMAPAPQRYLLLSQSAIIAYPSVGFGWEVAPGVRLGGTFEWVISYLKFSNVAQGVLSGSSKNVENPADDLRADLTVKSYFTPAFVVGALISPARFFDFGVSFRWSGDIDTTNTTVQVTGPYPGNSARAAYCPAPTTYPTTGYTDPCALAPNNQVPANASTAHFVIAQPWDLKMGFRYHQPRTGAVSSTGSARDPMSMDVFDVELDVTYSHNSSLDKIGIAFPAGMGVNFGSSIGASNIPTDASVPHQWQDVWGFRLGGEYVLLPNQLAVRAGGYFQTTGIDAGYLGIDFSPTQQFGLYAGTTYRTRNFDLSLGLGHVFYKSLDNGGNGNVYGLLADPTAPDATVCKTSGVPPTVGRMCGPQNGGSLTQSLNILSLGVTKHF
ncbi:MAG: OmpP1/FadL family transporter, partial [Polyangiales bacterium]